MWHRLRGARVYRVLFPDQVMGHRCPFVFILFIDEVWRQKIAVERSTKGDFRICADCAIQDLPLHIIPKSINHWRACFQASAGLFPSPIAPYNSCVTTNHKGPELHWHCFTTSSIFIRSLFANLTRLALRKHSAK